MQWISDNKLSFTVMAQATKQKQLNVIVEQTLSGCINRANDAKVTGTEFKGIYPIKDTLVLVYYR